MDAIEAEPVDERQEIIRIALEEPIIPAARHLRRAPIPAQVRRDHAVIGRQGSDERREVRASGARKAMDQQDGWAGAEILVEETGWRMVGCHTSQLLSSITNT
jgi:hypothetical protein